MKHFFCLVIIVITFTSCEKNINFDLKNADDVLVVDAQIENGVAPTVVLTKSFGYFSTISPALLAGSFVHNAVVTISNGTLTHTMKEYALPLGGGYTAYYYTIDTANLATSFPGQFNTQYTLHIMAEGKEYDAQTTIPALTKYPDSLWFKPAPLNPDTNKRVLMTRTTDPPGLGNYVRYFTKKNSGNFLPGENSVFDDAIIDGTTYEIQVDPGVDRNNKISADSNFFKRGDTVTVKLCNIDKATYTFWNTWEFAQQSNGNPFSQPNKVIGNISNGALGAFYGYAAWYKTLIAK
ncbi:MAG: DUF4249 domain-containing protein [Bacteroidetes bacterium]|nr:DUF4249 domain-containing protein [Bacteroidota bacterium]